jgi:hypothetical protein
MPAFSLLHTPLLLTVQLLSMQNAPLPPLPRRSLEEARGFGVRL